MKPLIKKLTEWIWCLLAILAINLAGSDGEWFPYLNFAAVGFLGFCLWIYARARGDSNGHLLNVPPAAPEGKAAAGGTQAALRHVNGTAPGYHIWYQGPKYPLHTGGETPGPATGKER